MNPFDVIIRQHSASEAWHYSDLDQLQRRLAEKIRLEKMRGSLILSEVAPVVTLGKRGDQSGLIHSVSEIQSHGIEIYETDRGGKATYHGEGQWVVFLVDQLENLVGDSKGVRKVVHALLDVALRVAQSYVPDAVILEGDQVGVWSPAQDAHSEREKLVSLGIKVEKGVLLHGLCFNGYPTPQSFYGVQPCGLPVNPGYLFENNRETNGTKMSRLATLIQHEMAGRFASIY